MYYKYCKQCGRPSNGYPLCKKCYYEQQRETEEENNRVKGGTTVNIDIGAIVQGIATIVQCFKGNQNNVQQPKVTESQTEHKKINSKQETSNIQRRYYQTSKGFYVKSKDERCISDFLTENRIFHLYEKPFPISEGRYLLPDFYIKGPIMFNGRIIKDIYIEHWGRENDEAYNQKKEEKLLLYKKAGITLINTYPDDIINYRESLTHKLTHYKEHQINY